MLNALFRVLAGLTILFLISCVHSTQDRALAEQCHHRCEQYKQNCQKTCRNSCPQCKILSQVKAVYNAQRYQKDKVIEGGIIARDLNSWRDPLQCKKITCDCPADYQVCLQVCGGIIHKQLQEIAEC